MKTSQLFIRNSSVLISRQTLISYITAIQKQLDRDFSPSWNIGIDLRIADRPENKTPPGAWDLIISDTDNSSGVLGYHAYQEGRVVGFVSAKQGLKYDIATSITLSHEILEMAADPYINTTVLKENTLPVFYCREVCDPVGDDQFAYTINNVKVSNFALPTWFNQNGNRKDAYFDFQKKTKNAFELLPGGYIDIYDVVQQKWLQYSHAQRTLRTPKEFSKK